MSNIEKNYTNRKKTNSLDFSIMSDAEILSLIDHSDPCISDITDEDKVMLVREGCYDPFFKRITDL